jgi:Na+-driven multidrug efflux pump
MVVTIPSLILTSTVVNRQNAQLFVYIVGLLLEIGLAVLMVKLGYGVKGVALAAIGVQAVITIASYILVHKHIFERDEGSKGFYALLLLPLVIASSFYFFHEYISTHVVGISPFCGLSAIAQIAAWGLVIYVFYREYVSLRVIKPFIARLVRA